MTSVNFLLRRTVLDCRAANNQCTDSFNCQRLLSLFECRPGNKVNNRLMGGVKSPDLH